MIQHFQKVPYFGITLTDLLDVASFRFTTRNFGIMAGATLD